MLRRSVTYPNIWASGHESPDDLCAAPVLHALDLTAPAVEVADDVAHELLGHRDLDLHDRLEDDRAGLAKASLMAMEPAILNAISDESTSWYDPSNRVTLTSTTGKPA
jgi:hypothetical protein